MGQGKWLLSVLGRGKAEVDLRGDTDGDEWVDGGEDEKGRWISLWGERWREVNEGQDRDKGIREGGE